MGLLRRPLHSLLSMSISSQYFGPNGCKFSYENVTVSEPCLLGVVVCVESTTFCKASTSSRDGRIDWNENIVCVFLLVREPRKKKRFSKLWMKKNENQRQTQLEKVSVLRSPNLNRFWNT